MSSPPAWDDVHGSGSSSTTFTTTVTGWHVLEVRYSRSQFRGDRSSTFVVGGHNCCITYVPDNGLSADNAVWICFRLQFSHSVAAGATVKVRSKYSLLDQAREKFYVNDDRICIKREEFESSYVKDGWFCIRCDVTVLDVSTQVLATVPPPPDMHRHLGDLLPGGVGADVTLEVGGEAFPVHKTVLAARSSVFKAEFFGGSIVKDNAAAARLRIDGIGPSVFKAMLHFIYTDTLPPEIERGRRVMAQHLLVAADRYNLERLKSMCEHILCSSAS